MSIDWNKFGENASKALDTANSARNLYREGQEIKGHIGDRYEYYRSEHRLIEKEKGDRLKRISSIICNLTFLVWGFFIIATIVLCVTGNDVILDLLHL